MKKFLKIVRNIFVGIILACYLLIIISISTLLLNKNDYGYTQFGNKSIILIDRQYATDKYAYGDIAIVQKKTISDLRVGEEVFIYYANTKTNSVDIVVSPISEIDNNERKPNITIAKDGSTWGEDYVAGTIYKTYHNYGKILLLLESKWIFFGLFMVPCFFILLYEVYLIIISVKYDDIEEDGKEKNERIQENLEKDISEVEVLKAEIEKLKNKLDDSINSEIRKEDDFPFNLEEDYINKIELERKDELDLNFDNKWDDIPIFETKEESNQIELDKIINDNMIKENSYDINQALLKDEEEKIILKEE